MALKNILVDIGSVLGLNVLEPTEQAYHIEKINEAAFEIYKALDAPGCHREQIFQYSDSDNYQIAFPWYVSKIRAIRYYNVANGGRIEMENLSPRFHGQRWGSNGSIKFRIVEIGALLGRSISNAGLFTFTLSAVETSNVVINLIGKTVNAERFGETLTIVAGQLSATTTQSYEKFYAIQKSAYNLYDITITDIDGETMGVISAARLKPSYTIVNIREDDFALTTNNSYPYNTIEVLYKTAFIPFRNMYDEFICPDCDKIIFWKYAEHYSAYKPDMEQKALMAAAKVSVLLKELCRDDDEGKSLQLNFEANPYYVAQEVDFLDRAWINNGGSIDRYV